VSLELFVDVILLITLWPLSQLSLLQKRLKGLFPGGKNIRCVRLTNLTPSWAFVMPSDNLKFVEPSVHLGPVMRLIYLFNPLKCRSPALRLLCSFVRILFRTWIFFSCGCCLLSCRYLGKADDSSRGFLLGKYVCLILRNLVTSKMRRSWTEVVCFVKGLLSFFIHCISASCRNLRICCHFAFHTGCNITVCNLSLSVPPVPLNPSRRQGRRYKLPGLGSAERGCDPYTLRVLM